MTALQKFRERRDLAKSIDLSNSSEPRRRLAKLKARDTLALIGGIGAAPLVLFAPFFAFLGTSFPSSETIPGGRTAIPGMEHFAHWGVIPGALIFGGFALYATFRNIHEGRYWGQYGDLIEEIERADAGSESVVILEQVRDEPRVALAIDGPSKPVAAR